MHLRDSSQFCVLPNLDVMCSPNNRLKCDSISRCQQLKKMTIASTHRLHSKIQIFFNDISNQRYKGFTSSFALSEYLVLIKELLAEKTGTIPSQNDINQAVKVVMAGWQMCIYLLTEGERIQLETFAAYIDYDGMRSIAVV